MVIKKMKIKLWKGNRLDREYEIRHDELYDKFISDSYFHNWKHGQTKYNLYHSLIMFITCPDGLNSVFESEDFEKLYNYVEKRVRLTYKLIEEINKMKKGLK